jgi:plastocyanin
VAGATRRTSRCFVASFVVCVALLLCSGCQGPIRGAAGPATHTVTMDGTVFVPADLTVALGDTVVWLNKDPFPHTATSKAGDFDSHDIEPDASWKYVTTAKGDFPYICSLHRTMKGTLHVK